MIKVHHFIIMVDCDINTKVRRCMHMRLSVENCVSTDSSFCWVFVLYVRCGGNTFIFCLLLFVKHVLFKVTFLPNIDS
jgi:hypothetical protein